MLNQMAQEIHDWAIEKGWWENQRTFGELIALIHTETSEAFEEYRNGHEPTEIYYKVDKHGQNKPEGIPVELADIIIRIADMAGRYEIDLEEAIRIKREFNKGRPHRHGSKRA